MGCFCFLVFLDMQRSRRGVDPMYLFSDQLKKWSPLPITLAWVPIIHWSRTLCPMWSVRFDLIHEIIHLGFLVTHWAAQIGLEVLVILPQQSESLLFSKAFDLWTSYNDNVASSWNPWPSLFYHHLYALFCFLLKQQEFISYKPFASPWRDLSLWLAVCFAIIG